MLRNVEVKTYIDEQLERLRSEKTADAQEALEYLTSVMREEQTERTLTACRGRQTAHCRYRRFGKGSAQSRRTNRQAVRDV